MNRNYTIPLKFLGNIEDKENIINNLMKIGLRIQEGGRIMNLGDNITKGTAMTKTLHLIKSNLNKDVKTIGVGDNFNDLEMIKKSESAVKNGYKVIAITASGIDKQIEVKEKYGFEFDFYTCDETALKTIIRSNPGALEIKSGTIVNKWHYTDFNKIKFD